VKRQVTFTEEEGGVFHIDCESCPLLPAFAALDKKPEACMAGMVTNMQGPVPIHTCKHYAKNSISNGEGKTLWLECGKEDA